MAHIHEKIDWCVETFIIFQNRVLLRKHDKYGIWLTIGGHIELDEGPVEAAKRECLEEVGLIVHIYGEDECTLWGDNVQDLPSPINIYRHPINETHEHIALMFFGTSQSNEITPENEEDVWQWFTKEEIENHPEVRPQIKKYALQALETLTS